MSFENLESLLKEHDKNMKEITYNQYNNIKKGVFDSEQLKPGQKVVFYCGDFNKNGRMGDLYLKVKAYKNGKLIAVSYNCHYMIRLIALH